MRFGHLDDDAREYVITRPDTPLPWINHLEGNVVPVTPARGRASRSRSAHADQVHDEHERLARADHAARAALAVREVGRDRQAPAAPDLHAGDALVPAADHLAAAELELERVPAVPGRVELLAGLPRHADVVDLDDLAGGGLVAVADL